jgi:hypothetical protein
MRADVSAAPSDAACCLSSISARALSLSLDARQKERERERDSILRGSEESAAKANTFFTRPLTFH